jgi:hypothetical protein
MFDPTTAKPREVESYLREQVRRIFGDKVENGATINSSHGYYNVSLTLADDRYVSFDNFRKADAPKIAKAMRALR